MTFLLKYESVIDSTQLAAKRIINNNILSIQNQIIVIWSDNQIAGYGKNQRDWYHVKGNLAMSIVYQYTNTSYDICYLIAIVIGNVLSSLGLQVQYKWLNDILIHNRKVAGILIEILNQHIIIGIGINIVAAPIITSTSLYDCNITISANELLQLILDEYLRVRNLDFSTILSLWQRYSIHKPGDLITIGNSQATFVKIDNCGNLIISKNNLIEKITSIEVFV